MGDALSVPFIVSCYYYYYKRFQCYQEPILLIASYTLLEPGPIHGPEVPGEFYI